MLTKNGVAVPSFMYGTAWKKHATSALVRKAVEAGFRSVDTANQLKHYDEAEVGKALNELIGQDAVTREQLFLQTKFTYIDGQDHRLPYDPKAPLKEQVQQSFASSLKHLHTDYLDSYVLHGPSRRFGLGDEDWEVWEAMEGLYNAGKTKLIGVSNVAPDQLQELCADAKVQPEMVQNRCYAIVGWDKEVRDLCKRYNIIYQGFSLLTANPQVLNDEYVGGLARQYKTGPAQIVFRFSQQIGMLPLTGTSNPEHMKEDLACESFSLTQDELAELEMRYVRS